MRSPVTRLVLAALAPVVFAFCCAASYLAAFHDPAPHHLPVGVVAAPAVEHDIGGALAARAPGAFVLERYPSARAALAAIMDRHVDGAVVIGAHRARLLVATVIGSAPTDAVSQALVPLIGATGHAPVTVVDLAPLPAGNRDGLGVFFLVLSVLLPSLLAGVLTTFVSRSCRALGQLGALAGFALLTGAVAAATADGLTGTLTGHYLATSGILALLCMAMAAPTAAMARFAPAGAALAALAFVVLGIPATGGPAGLQGFIPAFFRALEPALPPSVAVPALTSVSYLGSHALAQPLLVLGAWAVAGSVVLSAVARRRAPNGGTRHSRAAFVLKPVAAEVQDTGPSHQPAGARRVGARSRANLLARPPSWPRLSRRGCRAHGRSTTPISGNMSLPTDNSPVCSPSA
jgi:hypothetical protein